MADTPLQVIKTVSALPSKLASNTFYLVRVGQGYDLYATDTTGSTAYKINVSPSQLTQAIDIAHGGTSATDAATARSNLDVLSSIDVLDYILGYKTVSLSYIIDKLFNNNEQGFAFDFNDLSTMFQDAAGTIPVTDVGQPVGLVLDKSGRGNHASQSTSSKRPILQKNATTGAYYLAFDGVDDFLVTEDIDFSASNNLSLFTSVIFNNTSGQSQFITALSIDCFENQGTFGLWRGYSGVSDYAVRRNVQWAEDLTVNNNNNNIGILTAVINSTLNVMPIRNLGTLVGSKTLVQTDNNFKKYPLYIGSHGVSLFFNGNLYSLIGIARVSTDAEITNTERAIAKNVGVTL